MASTKLTAEIGQLIGSAVVGAQVGIYASLAASDGVTANLKYVDVEITGNLK